MASLVALIIFIAIVISQAVATTDDNILQIDDSNESQGKNMTELTMQQISLAIPYFSDNGEIRSMINNTTADNTLALSALRCCQELLPLAMDNLNKSLSTDVANDGLMSLICSAGTNLETCVEGFEDQPHAMFESVYNKLKYPIDLNRGTTKIMARADSKPDLLKKDSEYPDWVSDRDRNLLEEDSKISANVVVAKDGLGKYKTISDAVKGAPSYSKTRYVIYVKSGVYNENVNIGSDKWNLMMFGDGMDKTIVTGNKSHGSGFQTRETATFAVLGEGFMARDIKFVNTAGAKNEQAVALLSDSDRSVFYRCSMEGYQDTLCPDSNRQFYRECKIYGTIDFIFGNAAVVIQKSSIFVRKPIPGQDNAITASGKTDAQCRTGIVVQSSTVLAAEDLTGVKTFLGRPWKAYATQVFLQNNLNDLIEPRGWRPFNPNQPTPDTVFLAEYGNKGNSANTAGRVNWKGVRVSLSLAEAGGFTVASFIQGNEWLPATQVPFDFGL
ncbi:pectinesterase-like [Salvia hispanica]|uniref:pectinesterase-like n=1 Tax=Salvia hispanica TaxID=49212 RepID=UPI002009CA33|nr:pectinesterase-like [Salvia hispanica]